MSNKLSKAKKAGKKKNEQNQKQELRLIIGGLCAILVILAVILFFSTRGGNKSSNSPSGDSANTVNSDTEVDIASVSGPVATIKVKDYGDIVVKLDEETAPITVENFVSLAKDGFYDGLTFHRVISGFMIQGGDPLGNGTGGSEKTIKGEFSSNGVDNPISHKRGVISMARSNDPDSASSQFFIVQADSPHLDGDYAGFGYVMSGMEIVDQICEDTPQGDNGKVEPEDQPIIESITIEE